MSDNAEKQLIREVLSGSEKAFTTLVRQYERLVLHIVTPLIGISQDREDICQEVFLKVFRSLSSFKQDAKLSTWIGNIAYNTSLNFLRKKRLVLMDGLPGKEIPDEQGDSIRTSDLYNHEQGEETPEQFVIRKETQASVSTAIDSLPEMQRITLLLFHYDGLSLNEISRITGCQENTVKSHLFRARKKLQELLHL